MGSAGERKLVTVAFVDLSGYTAISAALDPEEVYRFLRPGIIALQRIVESFGGTVPQIMGDGFMGVFGVPSAHEDDEERAVRAALAVRNHVAELNAGRRGILFPSVHAGVNSGEVMVAPSEEPAGFAVIGDTVNMASRMADLAPAGTILVDHRTRDRTAHAIRYGPLRSRRVKGKREPLETYEALGSRPDPATRRGPSSVFVDRRDALARIREELRSAERSSRSRVLLVTGEAGTGKSRLAAELRRRRVGKVLVGRCPAFGNQLPLRALADAVGSGLGLAPSSARGDVDAVARRFGRSLPRSERLAFARDLRLLLGAERVPSGQPRGSVHDAARAARVAIEVLAAERPTIVVIDDVHWADADLMQLLRAVQREPWPAPILFLPLSRPGPGLRGIPAIELSLLEAEDMRALARDVLGNDVPAEAFDETLRRAGGNPLFLEETLGMLVEAGALAQRGDAWEVADPDLLRGVPSTIRRLIAARLDGLPPREKATLQDAAVAGDVVWDGLLEHLAEGRGVGRALASLERRGLLVRREPSALRGTVEYEVRHVLISEVAYESLPRNERSAKHLAVAAWLQLRREDLAEEPVAWLAHHYERAWELARTRTGPAPGSETATLAVRYLGAWGTRTFAYQARLAESIYARALAVARSAGGAIDPAATADLLVGRAESLIEMGRHPEALADAAEALALADRLQDRGRRARALLSLGRAESDLGRFARARVLLEDARGLFHAESDLRGEAWCLHRRSESWSDADYARELADLEASYQLFARSGDRWGRSIAAQDLAYVLTPRGGREFQRWFALAARLAGDEADLRSRATLARTAGYASFYRGDYARAIVEMLQARPLAATSGDRYAEADALCILAMCETAVGSPEDGERHASELLRLARELGSARLRALGLLAGARAAVRLGSPSLASRRLTAAGRIIEDRHQSLSRADLYGVDASVRLDRGVLSGIGLVTGRLASAARRHGWGLPETVAQLVRGRAALGIGRTEAAHRDLASASRLARTAGGTGLARLAGLLAVQARLLAGRPPRPSGARRVVDHAYDHETRAIALENGALAEVRAGRLGPALEGFADAVESWEQLGTTYWCARALGMASVTARVTGDVRAAGSFERRSGHLFDQLRTPAADRASTERAIARAITRG